MKTPPFTKFLFAGTKFILLGLVVICGSLVAPITSIAQGNLLIMPKRLVFDGSKRFEEMNVANVGTDSATYVISFMQIRMKEDGSFEKITDPDPGQMFADKFLRFYPRTVTLAPNESQTIKVQVTKTSEMGEGEFRSHLYFRALPKETPLGEKVQTNDSGISVKLTPVFGISVPTIIRNGSLDAKVTISDIKLQSGENPSLALTFNRVGNKSVYGDILVEHIAPNGIVTKMGEVKGMSVYTPNKVRFFTVGLNPKTGVDLKSGKIKVSYFSDQSANKEKLAEGILDLK